MRIKDYLTIVIPCKNEEKYIKKTLINIINQNNIECVKIYIADANSTDETLNIIYNIKRDFYEFVDIEIINGGNVSKGRNNGLKLVKTPYVLFLDADTLLLDKSTISNYLNLLLNNNLKLTTAPIKNISNDKYATLAFKMFNVINKLLSIKQPFAVGMFFMCQTCEIKKFGGFDETVIHSEDYLLSKQFNINDFKIGKIYVGQDNRRFAKFGYFKMIKMMILGFIHQKNIHYFRKNNGYWL